MVSNLPAARGIDLHDSACIRSEAFESSRQGWRIDCSVSTINPVE